MTRAWPLLLVVAVGGCVFRASDSPRYFRPDSASLAAETVADSEAPVVATIRLRAVRARPFLRERIVWRTPVEYGMYEQRRWSELPAAYAERALTAALLHTGIRLTEDTRVPALYADVTAFDEVLTPTHVANVAIVVALTDANGRRVLERTFSSDAAIPDDDPRSLAHAIGRALDDVSAQAAESVAAALRRSAHPETRVGGRAQHRAEAAGQSPR